MARSTWMSERAVRFQSGCFLHLPQTAEHVENESQDINVRFPELDRFLRYQSMHDRAYDRAANALAKHRKERAAQEHGFVSQKRAEAADARREKQEKQRDELHEIRQRRQKIKLELDQIRFVKQFPPAMRPQAAEMLQAAA